METKNTKKGIKVSTPSRLCLFGEHLDYLGLEVIACAIDLRFFAQVTPRNDNLIEIYIRDSRIDTLGMENKKGIYEGYLIDPDTAIVYENERDYIRSTVAVLLRNGVHLKGCTIIMDSDIPIGKGMSSSSTMIVVLIKALLEISNNKYKDDPKKIAYWAYLAEVEEFGEPGGMMDHYSSAIGGMINLDFANNTTAAKTLPWSLGGKFILFDSKEKKNTTAILASAKNPALRAIEKIGLDIKQIISKGASSFETLLESEEFRVLLAACENYELLNEAKELILNDSLDEEKFGSLLYSHHEALRDGLGISTPKIEKILDTAMKEGALGGKINGSGGGGCCFVYARSKDCEKILNSINALGYPGQILKIDTGVRVESE